MNVKDRYQFQCQCQNPALFLAWGSRVPIVYIKFQHKPFQFYICVKVCMMSLSTYISNSLYHCVPVHILTLCLYNIVPSGHGYLSSWVQSKPMSSE